MRSKAYILTLLGLGLAAVILVQAQALLTDRKVLSSQQEMRPRLGATPGATKPGLVAAYGKLPLSFEANRGQTDEQVKFLSRGRGYTLFLTGDEAVLALRSQKSGFRSQWENAADNGPRTTDGLFPPLIQNPKSQIQNAPVPSPQSPAPSVLRVKLAGADPNPKVVGLDELPGKSNYFLGNDPRKWRTNVPNYRKVKYENVYPGIDLVYYGNQGRVEHDFVVAPGADPKTIRLAVDGAAAPVSSPAKSATMGTSPVGGETPPLQIDPNGDLVITTDTGEVRFHKPLVYQPATSHIAAGLSRQDTAGGLKLPLQDTTDNPKPEIQNRKSVEGRFLLAANNRVAFELGPYDNSLPLIIDPVLEYSTYLGGSDGEYPAGIAVDASGDAYVTGVTWSMDFPTMNPLQTGNVGDLGAFVTKLSAGGDALVYSTYLGGAREDRPEGIAVDPSGNAYVTGMTWSTDFPTSNPLQPSNAGSNDAFVAKLGAAGDVLVFSTYLGGTDSEGARGIAVDGSGNIYVNGETASTDFPTVNPLQPGHAGGWADAFVAKMSAAGDALVYSTYLGGTADDIPTGGIGINTSGNAYVAGVTYSADFPTMNPFQGANAGDEDAFVAKLGAAGDVLVFSTYLGGSYIEFVRGVGVDAAGNAYVTGTTYSVDFPTMNPLQPGYAGAHDVFVTKLSLAGDALVHSTYLGGSGVDGAWGIAIDTSGNAYVTGHTTSTDFPTMNPLQPGNAGGFDAFVAKLNAAGDALVYATYLGGAADEFGHGAIAVDAFANAYVTGQTESIDFPIVNPLQAGYAGGDHEVFVARVSDLHLPRVTLSAASLDFGGQLVDTSSAPQTVTLANYGSAAFGIVSIDATGDFVQTNTCGGEVGGGMSCTISVTFTPTATGDRSGSVTITDDTPGSQHTVTLSGTGTDFTLSADPTSRTISAGQSTTYTLSVNPVSGFNETVALSCSGAPQRANCSLSSSTVTPDGTNAAQVTVTVTTTARGMAAPQTRIVPPSIWPRYALPLLAFMSLVLLGAAALRRRRANLALAGILLCVTLWPACGGGQALAQLGTRAGTYTLTLTGSVGSVSRQTTVTLTVN